MILRAVPFTLHLKHRFTLATGSRITTPAVLVECEADGVTGYGEASMPPYLGETTQGTLTFLEEVQSIVQGVTKRLASDGVRELEPLLAAVDRCAPGHHAAKAAVDIALHDWLGKFMKLPCHRLRGIEPGPMPFTSYTIGIGDPDFIRDRVGEASEFRILKVKLGAGNDREIIGTIRNLTDVPLRIDANQGWKERDEAARFVDWLGSQNVELVEQPFPKDRIEDTAWLRERSPVPLVADESIARLSDLGQIRGVFDGVNIKLMKCTGMAEAHAMIVEARSLGLRVMLGCMTETSCGISAAAQLASLVDWADLDGALLISNDPFIGAPVRDGRITMPEGSGIGVQPRRG